MNILYCDCFSGISGDMLLAAMIDAGLPVDYLHQTFNKLALPEYRGIESKKVMKTCIQATSIQLDFDEDDHHHGHVENHHGLQSEHGENHDDCHLQEHSHEKNHHVHRSFADIKNLLNQSALPEGIRQNALKIFATLAIAEAEVHGVNIDEVHFHEVGAVDSILDIVGIAAGLVYFNIDKVYSSPLPIGSGTVFTQHGVLPVPAPAVVKLLQQMKAPIAKNPGMQHGELTTPTGAAFLTAFATFDHPEMTILHSGIGAGNKDFSWANIMRVFIGNIDSSSESIQVNSLKVLETNIDDMTPEFLSPILQLVLDAGALDAWFTPIYMKKNRSATKFSALVRQADEEKITQTILRHTTTLGVRSYTVSRMEAEREMRVVQTEFGEIRVKSKYINQEMVSDHPEFEDCHKIAEKHNLPALMVYNAALKAVGFASSDDN